MLSHARIVYLNSLLKASLPWSTGYRGLVHETKLSMWFLSILGETYAQPKRQIKVFIKVQRYSARWSFPLSFSLMKLTPRFSFVVATLDSRFCFPTAPRTLWSTRSSRSTRWSRRWPTWSCCRRPSFVSSTSSIKANRRKTDKVVNNLIDVFLFWCWFKMLWWLLLSHPIAKIF